MSRRSSPSPRLRDPAPSHDAPWDDPAADEAQAAAVEHLSRRLWDSEARLAEARTQVAESERRLDAVYHSTSWRVTAPLRRLVGPREATAGLLRRSTRLVTSAVATTSAATTITAVSATPSTHSSQGYESRCNHTIGGLQALERATPIALYSGIWTPTGQRPGARACTARTPTAR